MKILTVVGARPQFIKAGAVSREISNYKEIKEIIVHTGQHYDANMSDLFFKELHLPDTKYFLGIGGNSQGAMTGKMIEKLEEVMLKEKPDIVLVYGDTNSTLAGALSAIKLHIPIAHVEAGLRSFNMKMSEEINRILTDRISKWLFCPTDNAVENLKKEGFENFDCKIIKSGDVMLDVALYYKNFSIPPKNVKIKGDFVLCTIHRAENTDDETRIRNIFEALNEIGDDIQLILPLHPRTKKNIQKLNINTQNITIIEPVGYLEMIWLLNNCKLVITDSGGLQKEAFFFKKNCVTLRDETEWTELTGIGVNVLAGAKKETILESVKKQLNNNKYENEAIPKLYGEGKASKLIIKKLLSENFVDNK